MNFEISSPNLQDLEQVVNHLITEGKCACHIINPHKTRILLWKQEKDGQTIYHLRIGIQKFTSQEQKDRNGETYWRMMDYASLEGKKEEIKEVNNQTEPNPITKFHQRPEKTEALNHGKSDNQQSNSPTS